MSEIFTDTELTLVAFLPFVTQFKPLMRDSRQCFSKKYNGEYGEEGGLKYGTKPPPPLFERDYNSKIALF